MFCALEVDRPRLQTRLRKLILNTVKTCDITSQIINGDRNNTYCQQSLLLMEKKGEELAAETLRLLTSLAGEADLHERYSSREIVRGSLICSNIENIMRTLSRMAKIQTALTQTEGSALNIEISSLTNTTLETLKICLRRLSPSFKSDTYINKMSANADFERKIQHAFETAMNEDDLEYSHKTLEMISAVESLNRSIYCCRKY